MGVGPSFREAKAHPVKLNLYDLGGLAVSQRLNNILRSVGVGGVFHCGVEIFGREYSFGYADDVRSGVYECVPRQCPNHSYRESVDLGLCTFSMAEVELLANRLSESWPARSYSTLDRNCIHFCEVFCKELEVDAIPGWTKNMLISSTPKLKPTRGFKDILLGCGPKSIASSRSTDYQSSIDSQAETESSSDDEPFVINYRRRSLSDLSG